MQCAIREVQEETGLNIHNVRYCHTTNDIMKYQGKHYVTIFMMAECQCTETRPKNLEPHKCEGWSSYSWDELSRFAKKSKDNEDGDSKDPILFGPLLQLVEDAPQLLLDYISKGANPSSPHSTNLASINKPPPKSKQQIGSPKEREVIDKTPTNCKANKEEKQPADSRNSDTKKRKRFTEVEDGAIRLGVERFGAGNWLQIKSYYPMELSDRTTINIKDRWRTLNK